MPRRYIQLDVFAPRPGSGNPLGVVLDAGDMDTAAMQALAAWLNLSETVFFLPPDSGADYHVRIFTPGSELPFAGHPSVGAAWAAVTHGLATPRTGRLLQQCNAGLLPVTVAGDADNLRINVRSPRGQCIASAPMAMPAQLQQIAHPDSTAELWRNGPSWWLVEATSARQLRALRPDFSAIAAWSNATAANGVTVYAREDADSHAIAVRAFCPGDAVGVPEDPVTGSANALVAARLHAQGRLPGTRYIASQGRELGRDGQVHVQADDAGEVWIGGQVQQIIHGRLNW